jgi:hypothetical protein
MPQIKGNPAQIQGVTGKAKTEDLFQSICDRYDPFQSRFVSFPLSVVAQARVWRGHDLPEEKRLAEHLKAFIERGFTDNQVERLIAYCESAIRPIRAAELKTEELLPEMLYTKSATWPPNSAGFVLLETEFFAQMKIFETKVGKGWVLAAGAIPLSIHGRPPLIAPWVVGVTMKRWLIIKKIPDMESESLALALVAILLGRTIRPEELRHWESLLNEIEVTDNNALKALLPGYLIDIGSRMQPKGIGSRVTIESDWTPSRYLQSIPFDESSVRALAKVIQKGWRHHMGTKTSPTSVNEIRAICNLCTCSITLWDVYDHFRDIHGILRDQIETEAVRRELRRARTKEVLLRYDT